jgi:ATP-binding cassette subfamily C (CFTR/MRP) protein 1
VKSVLPREDENRVANLNPTSNAGNEGSPTRTRTEDEFQDLTRATGDFSVYQYYFRSVGRLHLTLFVGFVLMNVVCETFSSIWLKWWTDAGGQHIVIYTSVYLLLAFVAVVGLFGYMW